MKHTCGTCKHYIYIGISKSAKAPCGWCDGYSAYMVLASDNQCKDWEPP